MFLRTVTKILFRTCKVTHLGLRKRRERITKAEAMVVHERGESMNVNERESKSREEINRKGEEKWRCQNSEKANLLENCFNLHQKLGIWRVLKINVIGWLNPLQDHIGLVFIGLEEFPENTHWFVDYLRQHCGRDFIIFPNCTILLVLQTIFCSSTIFILKVILD